MAESRSCSGEKAKTVVYREREREQGKGVRECVRMSVINNGKSNIFVLMEIRQWKVIFERVRTFRETLCKDSMQ